MVSFKGILKYSIYLFIAGWMFLLGIMVGRGSSPITFDTQKFQKRLEVIAREFGEKKGARKKIDLKFYDVLDHPVPEERVPPKLKPLEIIPKKETIMVEDTIPLKTSRKKQTFKKEANKAKTDTKDLKPAQIKTKPPGLKKDKASEQLTDKKVLKGKYTIQIAAYKEFKDAITQMTILEKKGFSFYRVKGQKEGVTWYRVRTGSFATYNEAKKIKEKFKKAKINSMIIKKE
ncbi:MAG: SPOR domain-containing protein [Desulfobacula sp.]|nr:SPOR domain-containing protein [Desulfobacula sp.]